MATIIHTVKLVASAKEANEELLRFQGGIVAVERSVASMERSLAGTGMLQRAHTLTAAVAKLGDATGKLSVQEQILAGVSKMTAAEQVKVNAKVTEAIAKYRLLGETAPSAMLALRDATAGASVQTGTLSAMWSKFGPQLMAFLSVGAVTRGVSSLVRWADDLDEVAQGIGVNVVSLQKLQYAWATTGSSVEAGTKAIQTMGEKISEGTAAQAIARLGLDFEALKRMAPEEQFYAITDALKTVTNQADFAALGADIFGKTWKSVGISVKNDMKGVAEQAQALTEEQVKFLAALQGKWDALVLASKVAAGRWLSGIGQKTGDITPGQMMIGRDAPLSWLWDQKTPGMPGSPGMPMMNLGLGPISAEPYLAKALEKVTKAVKANEPAVQELRLEWTDYTTALAAAYLQEWTMTHEMELAAVKIQEWREPVEVATEGTADWGDELDKLSDSFRRLAQTSGTSGLGAVANGLANVVGGMRMGKDAGDALGKSWEALSTRSGWTAENLTGLATSSMQAFAAMNVATQTTSRWANALGGAATGASLGAQFGSVVPGIGTAYGAAIGAGVGAIYGASKDNTQNDTTQEIINQWAAVQGGFEMLEQQYRMTGASMAQFNLALQTGEDDLEKWKLAAGSVSAAIDAWKRRLDGLRAATVGTKTLADALDINTTQTQFERLGIYVTAIFGKMIRESGSLAEALGIVSDTLDKMLTASDKYGFPMSGALGELLGLRGTLTANPDLAARITGLGQVGQGLGPQMLQSMGLVSTFGADLEETYKQLLGRGVGQDQAMLLMQGPMQQLWQAANNPTMRRTLEPDTLALLKQFESAGFVGPDMLSVAERQLSVLGQIRDLLAGVVPPNGWDGTTPETPGLVWRVRRPTPVPDHTFALGTNGFENFGAGTPAMLHGWEAVVPYSRAGEFSRNIGAGAGAGGETVIHVHTNLDGRQVAQSTVRYLPNAVSRYGVH